MTVANFSEAGTVECHALHGPSQRWTGKIDGHTPSTGDKLGIIDT